MFFISVEVNTPFDHIRVDITSNAKLLQNITKYHETLVNGISKNFLCNLLNLAIKEPFLHLTLNYSDK